MPMSTHRFLIALPIIAPMLIWRLVLNIPGALYSAWWAFSWEIRQPRKRALYPGKFADRVVRWIDGAR